MLPRNPARRFHEAIGGRLLTVSKDFELGGERLVEVAYGWDDLAELGRRLGG